jgi:hypothetical protein
MMKSLPVAFTKINPAMIVAAAMLISCGDSQPPNLLVNPGFEELTKNGRPAAWRAAQHAGKIAYTYELDAETVFDGVHSYKIEQYAEQAYGIVKQIRQLPDEQNKAFSFTAMLKTKDVAPGMGLKLTVNCIGNNSRILKQYLSEPTNGTTDWQKVTLEGDIPKGTVKLDIGIMLGTFGVGWVDETYLGVY